MKERVADAQVKCSDKKTFSFEGREVSFTYVAYGALQDCSSGIAWRVATLAKIGEGFSK